MNIILLLVGLSSGFAHSIYSAFSKALLKNRIKEPFLLFLYVSIIQAIVTPILWIFIHPQFPPSAAVAPLLMSCFTCVGAYLFLYMALHSGDASSVMPIMGSKVIFAGLLAIPMLGETHNWQVYIALVLVAISIAMLGYAPSKNGSSRFPMKPVLLMTGCAVIFGFTDIFIKRTLLHLDPYNFMIYYNFLVGVLALSVIPSIRKKNVPLILKGKTLLLCFYASVALVTATLLFVVLFEISSGVVIANVLQSTRGIFIVLITGFLAHRGSTILETQSGKVYLLRLTASVLIIFSIWITLSHAQ
jgi:uncharacterized membrane protein